MCRNQSWGVQGDINAFGLMDERATNTFYIPLITRGARRRSSASRAI